MKQSSQEVQEGWDLKVIETWDRKITYIETAGDKKKRSKTEIEDIYGVSSKRIEDFLLGSFMYKTKTTRVSYTLFTKCNIVSMILISYTYL